jgi:DNA-binding response OmpR family regulator
MDGIEFCKEVRQRGFTQQILMLTALNADNNMVEGLDAGADDYLGKPFSYPVLIAKLKAMLRRVSISGPQTVLQLADLQLNTTNRTVMRGETLIKLTAREFHLLYYLLRHKGQIKTRSQILEAVWGLDFDPGTNVVDVYLNYLRAKIDKPFEHKLLHTYIGMGYALREKA